MPSRQGLELSVRRGRLPVEVNRRFADRCRGCRAAETTGTVVEYV